MHIQSLTLLIFIIALAFLFDFLNGFHDAANSIATVVSTRVLKPFTAVLWASFFNFIAFLFFKLNVAATVGTGLVNPHIADAWLILAALVGAIIWDIVTWYIGLPTSSSHALIGGLVGAALAKAGWHSLNFFGLSKVIVSIFLSPFFGFIIALSLLFFLIHLFFDWSPSFY
jgi:PiT family inorganic phosphate transporter